MNLKETELCLGLPGGGEGESSSSFKISGKRGFSQTVDLKLNLLQNDEHPSMDLKNLNSPKDNIKNFLNSSSKIDSVTKPPAKTQVVGWPPVRSYRKNIMAQKSQAEESKTTKTTERTTSGTGSSNINTGAQAAAAYVKVSMDGAPYLRKVDLKMYNCYQQLSDALGKMFSSFTMGNYGSQGMIDFMNESKLMDLLNSSEYVPSYEDKDGDWMLVGDVPWEMFVNSCKRLRIMKGSEAIGLAPRAMQKCKNR